MKKTQFASLMITALLLIGSVVDAQTNSSSPNLLRHIVIITFKPGASPDSIKALDVVYKDLSKSPFVKDFEMGVNVSTRDSGTLKHVYVTSFASREEMKNYSKIPEYQRLFKLSLPIAEGVTVADYWINK